MDDREPRSRALAPLYLAGFTTAFGAHGVATAVALEAGDLGMTLLTFGVVLALYDVAEVVLKPLFGALSDRIGPKPVIVGGLAGFALASAVAVIAPLPVVVALARFGQGAAASAFSPASSGAVSRLAGRERLGRYFGRYGAWKSLGYAGGPLLGAALVTLFGMPALYVALTLLAVVAAIWALVAIPALPALPRARGSLSGLTRRLLDRGFLVPTLALATATGLLGVAVGFLPLLATRSGLPPVLSAAPVALLAITSAVLQPLVGRAYDRGRVGVRAGVVGGLLTGALGVGVLALGEVPLLSFVSAVLVGACVATATPLAYAQLAANTPPEHIGSTMGNAEIGREVGDAGGPLLVGALGGLGGLPVAFVALAVISAASSAAGFALRPRPRV